MYNPETKKHNNNQKKNTVQALSLDLCCLGFWSSPSSLVLRASALAGDLHTKALKLKTLYKSIFSVLFRILLLVYVNLIYRSLKTFCH